MLAAHPVHPALPAVAALLVASGCGARSSLVTDDERSLDASTRAVTDGAVRSEDGDYRTDGDPPRPCSSTVSPGTVRAELPAVVSSLVFDRLANLYAIRGTVAGTVELVQWDGCYQENWSVPLPFRAESAEVTLKVGRGGIYANSPTQSAVVSSSGEVLVPLTPGDAGYVDLASTRPYPIVVSWDGVRSAVGLAAYPEVGARLEAVAGLVGGIPPDYGSCLVAGELLACAGASLAVTVNDLSTVYSRPIVHSGIGGIARPATDGELVYVTWHSGSSMGVRAFDPRTGVTRWSQPLISFASDSTVESTISAPVFSAGVVVVFYAGGPGIGGELVALDSTGTFRWAFPLIEAALEPRRLHPSTHVVGDAGFVYLVSGNQIHAIRLSSGEEAWRGRLPVAAAAGVNMSPSGDVVVRSVGHRALVIATESTGPAPGGWPIVGHDPQATYAFEP